MTVTERIVGNAVPVLTRLALAAALIPLGWNAVAGPSVAFQGDAARTLQHLDVGQALPQEKALVTTDPETGEAAPVEEPARPRTVLARPLHRTTVMLANNPSWPPVVRPDWTAWLLAGTELIAGALILLGLFTRLCSVGVAAVLALAFTVTSWGSLAEHGLFAMPAAEFHLASLHVALFVLAVILMLLGAGAVSLDRLLLRRGTNESRLFIAAPAKSGGNGTDSDRKRQVATT